jgi:DNA-binding winged helix-turn-helix (wHTH) protein
LRAVWPDTIVEEGNLADNISRVRKALGEGEDGQKFIETIPRRGYRFVAEVRQSPGETPAQAAANRWRASRGRTQSCTLGFKLSRASHVEERTKGN